MGRFARDLAAQDLSIESFDVLVHLAWATDGTLPLRDLVASMVSGYHLSRSGLTRLLDRMERDGLVERNLRRDDRRQFDVAITGQGRGVFDRVWPDHVDGIGRYFSAPLADRDVIALGRILDKLVRANERPVDDPPDPGARLAR